MRATRTNLLRELFQKPKQEDTSHKLPIGSLISLRKIKEKEYQLIKCDTCGEPFPVNLKSEKISEEIMNILIKQFDKWSIVTIDENGYIKRYSYGRRNMNITVTREIIYNKSQI